MRRNTVALGAVVCDLVGGMMHKHWAILLLLMGCGEETVPGECEPGFVKKQGRWCVFDEAALQAAL